jgi:ribose transport system ATP-binding protein
MHSVAEKFEAGITAHVPVMTLADIRKSFGPVQALKGVDVLIMPGEVHAIVGENGAGKSTLIGIAAGVLQADAGAIYYAGKYVEAPSARRMREDGVSVVYQHPVLANDLTVLENLQLAAPSLAASGGNVEADRILGRVATAELLMPLNKRVGELSLAQKHVVEIACALATRPKVLFLDEPTEPLQQADVRKLFSLIGELKRDGVGIVYVSHRLHEVDELADRVSVMRDGEIIDSRPAQTITSAEIVALIAGRPLGQIFPAKAKSVGAPLFTAKSLSGRGFDQIDLVVHAGEIVGLAGIEGEGQREFIRTAAGIDRRHGGEVSVKDAGIAGDSPGAFRNAGVGFIPDDRHSEGVFLNLTLRENFSLGFLNDISRFGIVDRTAEAAKAKNVSESLRVRAASIESKLNELSGGNQQKALFGREIAAQPTVLLVDEPTKGVDIGARGEIYQRLRGFAEQGMAVLVSSSDGIELEGICDRVLIFARGRIVNELVGAEVTDAAITKANLTATVSRASKVVTASRESAWRRFYAGDHFPAVILAVLTLIILGGTQALNSYFLSPFSIKSILSFLGILAFLSSAQLATVLVGSIDLSIGPLAGFCVVLASFLAPDGVEAGPLAAGVLLILLFTSAFGFLHCKEFHCCCGPWQPERSTMPSPTSRNFPWDWSPPAWCWPWRWSSSPNGYFFEPRSAGVSVPWVRVRLPVIGSVSIAAA